MLSAGLAFSSPVATAQVPKTRNAANARLMLAGRARAAQQVGAILASVNRRQAFQGKSGTVALLIPTGKGAQVAAIGLDGALRATLFKQVLSESGEGI
jgi:hypothetical protein